MSYINQVRESMSTYNAIGGISLLDLQSVLGVLIGTKCTPELSGKLAALGIRKLVDMTMLELQEEGLSTLQAQNVHAGCLMAKALKHADRRESICKILNPQDAANYVMDELSGMTQEHCGALFLNIKNEVIHKETIFIGTLNGATVQPREILRLGVKHAAYSFMFYHCHPSGCAEFSDIDVAFSKRLKNAGEIVGIELLDSFVIGDQNYVSLSSRNVI